MAEEERIRLIIIGGGEDKKADKKILKEVVFLSGAENSHIAIVTTATNYPLEVGEEYRRIFYELGAGKVGTINIVSRKEANRKQITNSLDGVTCIFFVGGDQLRISSILGGTEFHSHVKRCLEDGVIIAGTSAGASMMSEVMVVEGEEEDAPRKCTLKMAPGMGFLEGVTVDQHFNQRGRIGRLLGAVAQNPQTMGIGIDEDTAIIVNETRKITVIGSGVVTIVDGKEIDYTNISEQYPNQALALTNVKVDILPAGYGYDLASRKAITQLEINKK